MSITVLLWLRVLHILGTVELGVIGLQGKIERTLNLMLFNN